MNQREFLEIIELLLAKGEESQAQGDYQNCISLYLKANDLLSANLSNYPELLLSYFLDSCDKLAFAYFELERYSLAYHYSHTIVNQLFHIGEKMREYIAENNPSLELIQLQIIWEHWFSKLDYYQAHNLYYLGMIDYENNDIQSALNLFDQALQKDSNLHRGYYGKGLCYLSNGLYEEAIEQFDEAISLFSNLYSYYLSRAKAYYYLGEIDYCLEDLDNCFAQTDGYLIPYSKTLLFLREIYLNSPDLSVYEYEYPNLYGNLKIIESVNEIILAKIEQIKERNWYNMYDEEISKSLPQYQQIIKQERKKLVSNLSKKKALRIIGEIWTSDVLNYHFTQQRNKDRNSLTQIIISCPSLSSYYFNRGVISYRQGDIFAAIQDFSETIKINPNNYPAYVERATCYQEIFDFSTAIDDLKKALQISNKDDISWHQLGLTYQKIYEYQQEFENLPLPDLDLAANKKALQCYNNAIKFSVEPKYYYYFNRGNCYQSLSQFDLAIQDYQASLSLNKQNLQSLIEMGNVYQKINQKKTAMQYWREALKIAEKINNKDLIAELKQKLA